MYQWSSDKSAITSIKT